MKINKPFFIFRVVVCFTAITCSYNANAGTLISAEARWNAFSFHTVESEPTPNYYGWGPRLKGGYSLYQVLDLALWGSYTPGGYGKAKFGDRDAYLYGYGGEIALRMAGAIFFALKGGQYSYYLLNLHNDDAVSGKWAGLGVGVSLGAFFAVSESQYWQVTLDWDRIFPEKHDKGIESNKRVMDSFAVGLAFVFNHYDGFKLHNTLLESFLNSLRY